MRLFRLTRAVGLAFALAALAVDGLALPLHSWLDHGHGSEERRALPGESEDPGGTQSDLDADCWLCAQGSSARRPALVSHHQAFDAPRAALFRARGPSDDAPPEAVVFAPAQPRAPPASV